MLNLIFMAKMKKKNVENSKFKILEVALSFTIEVFTTPNNFIGLNIEISRKKILQPWKQISLIKNVTKMSDLKPANPKT